MTWANVAVSAVALLLAGALGFVLGRRSSPSTQAVPLPPRPPDVPGKAEEQRRKDEAGRTAEQARTDPDPGKTASDIMRRPAPAPTPIPPPGRPRPPG